MLAWKNVEPYIRNETFKNPNLFIDNPDFRDYIYDHSQTLSKYLISPENANLKKNYLQKSIFQIEDLTNYFMNRFSQHLIMRI